MADELTNSGFFMALDAMENLVASLGTDTDKRLYTRYVEKYALSRRELEAMYAENWLAAKIVDVIPDDMTREWRQLNNNMDPARTKEFEHFEEDMQVALKFNEAAKWGRLYGGCGIILGIDEAQGGPPEEPLEIDFLGKDCLEFLTVVEAERLQQAGSPIVIDPTNPFFDRPEYYSVANGLHRIHRSRILFFEGIPLPHYMRQRQRLSYWGAPVLRRVMEAITNADLVFNGTSTLTSEASTDIIKYKGLTSFLAQPGGEEKIRARFSLMKLLKSLNNITLLDEEETFENHQQTFAGLSDLIDKFLAITAGAADIPVTRLVGTSAKGLNATGEGDLKNYYDNIRARQGREFSPQLRRLDAIMQRHLWGVEDENWGFTWNSLFQLNEKEIAELQNNRATRDQNYLNMGVIDELVIAEQLYEDDTYTTIDQEYLNKLKKDIEQARKDQEMMQKLMLEEQQQAQQQQSEPDDNDEDLLAA